MIYIFFFSTEKGSAVLGLNGIRQTQCAMELIKFCGNWMHELRADLAGTVPKAANCFSEVFLLFALFLRTVFLGHREANTNMHNEYLFRFHAGHRASPTVCENSRHFP